ncbi:MerR family transcriptional regulator [Pseudonocardia sp. HH130630-07]|uniref:MerR family transcriptional regulator n=1 Tax=Pseudonocardia sp. HH130630-07 TaxID=1690815 RepID=UPI0008151A89|nr:MerR family transcriptional regulator [Pseudonocardia sp. HH130630-07]ANY08529.1 hypothetical protein AFB00_22175 [Pseudonocardia sp. HH130630-07]
MQQIGEVAGRVGLSLRTIRHWDELGLVTPSARSAGGFRLYTEDDVERLRFVKTLRPLDLDPEQILDLLSTMDAARTELRAGGPVDDDRRRRIELYRTAAESRIEALHARIHGLELLSRELRALTRPDDGAGRAG